MVFCQALRSSLLLFLLVFASPVFAQSRITANDKIEITSRNQRLLTALSETSLGLPTEPVRPKEVVVIFAGGGGLCTLLCLGLPQDQSADLAKAIQKGLGDNPIANMELEHGSDEGKAVVKGKYEFGSFGKREGSLDIPIGKMSAVLQAEGWQPTIYLRTYPAANVTAEGMKLYEGARTNTYGARSPRADTHAIVTVSVSPILTGAFYFFLFGPWALTLAGLLTAYAVAKSEKIPIKRRRAIYPKLATWPAFGSIAVHAPFAIWFIAGRGYQVFTDLWFSSASATTIMPFVILPLLPIILTLPLVNRVEKKLFGPDEDSPPIPEMPEVPEAVKAYNQQVAKLGVLVLVVGIALILLRAAFFEGAIGLPFMFVGLGLALFSRQIAESLLKKQKPDLAVTEEETELATDLADLAHKMGIQGKVSIKIDAGALGMTTPYASVNLANVVTVSWRLRELLDRDERRAILAHELAHVKLGHLKQRKFLFVGIMAVFALPVIIMPIAISRVSLTSLMPIVMAAPIALFPIMLIFGMRWKRSREYASDRLMLETTRDLQSAISALTKLTKNSPMPHIHENEVASSHPAMSKRIERLRELALELGLD
jgi:Zn-dependent protease with chaperone function